MTQIAGSGSEPGSGSISQRHGSADPDLPRNVMDPQHWMHAAFLEDKSFHLQGHRDCVLRVLLQVLKS
jgi:hypothetical protein